MKTYYPGSVAEWMRNHPVARECALDWFGERIPASLHQRASLVARVTGRPVRAFVQAGLERELRERTEGKPELLELMEQLMALDRARTPAQEEK